jgi:hypothetical protein
MEFRIKVGYTIDLRVILYKLSITILVAIFIIKTGLLVPFKETDLLALELVVVEIVEIPIPLLNSSRS